MRVYLRARDGDYPVQPGNDPVGLQVLLGRDSSQCGEVFFRAAGSGRPECRFHASGRVLRCR